MEKFDMYKEYSLEEYKDALKEIENSKNPESMVFLMGYLGATIIQNNLVYGFLYNEDEIIDLSRRSFDKTKLSDINETAGLFGRYMGTFLYCIPDFPEKFVLITKPKGE